MAKRNACKGFCCMSFTLSYSPSQVARLSKKKHGRDGPKVRDMVIYLGRHKTNPIVSQSNDDEVGSHYYTCKWFDAEARNCLNYEDRPTMCADFPYALSTCPYEGCGHYNGKLARRLNVLTLGEPVSKKVTGLAVLEDKPHE